MQTSKNPRFESLPLLPALVQVTRELGFETLTQVQEQAIPLMLSGRDLIAQSQTGSGKTAAFALPILQRLGLKAGVQHERHLEALVLCPTRELCTQVASEIRKLGRRHPGLQVLVVSGGQPMFAQISALERGVHIVVGTPGRVLDHLNRRTLDLRQASTVVLDEADRMLDMGFQADMEAILSQTPSTRQTVLFSATFPRSIEAMSRAYQRSPARVTIQAAPEATPDIRQVLIRLNDDSQKAQALLAVIAQHKPESAIVFCNLKANVMGITQILGRAGVSAAGLHGDLEQRDRDRVMAKFRNQSTRVLVATDVAARGIDVAKLDLVVNFDLPSDPEVYVHRIGRTGRAGQKGLAISLANNRERAKAERIQDYSGQTFEFEELAQLPELPPEPTQAPSKALVAPKADALPGALAGAKMETLYIAGGRKEKMRPGDILGALTGEAGGLKASDIGKIEIHDHFSYVAVSKELAQAAMHSLNMGRIKGRKFRVGLAH